MYLEHCIALLSLILAGVRADAVPELSQQPIILQSEHDEIFDSDFDDFVERTLKEWHVPGLSIAVVDNGKITSKGYGFAVLPDRNATADTQYFTGSTTKAFTAAAIAKLVHDDKYPEIKWTSPISEFIRSDFVLEDPYATTHTTIEDALSHRSGLPRHDLIYGQPNDTPSSIVQRLRYLPMTAEPRTIWQYCNLMFVVMTDLIETITGAKLETILRDNLWKPLGMSSTTFTIPSEVSAESRLARGYYWNSNEDETLVSTGDGEYIAEPYIDLLPISGAGATISTVNDYALWVRALLNAAGDEKSRNASSPITHDLFRDLVSPRAIVTDTLDDEESPERVMPALYALGWITGDYLGTRLVAHAGGLTGFGTELYLVPSKNYGIVTMGNTGGTSNVAGALIVERLLLPKLGSSDTHLSGGLSLQNTLRDIQKATLGPARRRYTRKQHSAREQILMRQTNHIPLPLSVDHFAGLYSHPGYGSINLTVNTLEIVTSVYERVLEGVFHPRSWPIKIQLSQIRGAHFSVKNFDCHGIGDVLTGEGVVWDHIADTLAVFEFGLDGTTVEMAGIMLEESMVEMAEEKGEKHWRESMIWFERVSK